MILSETADDDEGDGDDLCDARELSVYMTVL